MKKYLKIWWFLTMRASETAFISRFGALIFIIGKILRFIFLLLFIVLLESRTREIAGYSLWQAIFIFATFNFIDTLTQFFLREVYRFRSYVVGGYFDFILTKPFSPLFRSLLGGSDILDLSILFISILFIAFSIGKIGEITLLGLVLYLILIFNAFLISLAFHIFVLSIGVLTTEVDNMIMLYRDFTQMGRFPIDIYKEPLKGFLTFIIPIGVMMTFPAKAIMNMLSFEAIFTSFFIGILFFTLSYFFWKFSLKHYSSVSN